MEADDPIIDLPSSANPLVDIDNDILNLHTITETGGKTNQDTPLTEDEENTESLRNEVFLPYVHRELVPGCMPHPGNIVEPASLAATGSVPEETADIVSTLPESTISQGKLSSLQLESIIKASVRHRVILPNGERAGFFIGDAAGVGKGRQIAGTIMDNYGRGRTKHVWFSVSTDLVLDAQKDLLDIGCHINVINGCKAIDKGTRLFGLSESVKTGVLFSTYSTLVSHVFTGAYGTLRRSRLEQLINWCGGADFEGCLVFDECHKAKNFVPGNENASSKVSMSVCAVQRSLPKARVLYCSATGVTDVKNMAFMERMGLWGNAAPFPNYEAFLETIQKKGLGVAEMLAMDMKKDGLYVSRMLSFSDAQFYNIECNLTDQQRLVYNMAARIWDEVRKALALAVRRCNSQSKAKIFWSQHQRFFQQLCVAMKVDMVVSEAKEAINSGKCVVIGIQNTGEANMDDRLSRDRQIRGFVSSCREILLNFLNNHFPVVQEVGDEAGILHYDQWSLNYRDLLIQYANHLELPNNALDMLIDKLGGASQVAEMTGRKGRIIRKDAKSNPTYEQRHSSCLSDQSLNISERNKFMSGEKLVAIISDAASTGISLHADRNCKNQRQRVHITLQLPWSADKAVQQLGRSHRSNQLSGPIYKLVTTDLGGERRFAASVARRLQSLGALTKGDRRAATGADLSHFNYDTVYGRTALKLMYEAICKGKLPNTISFASLANSITDEETFICEMQNCVVTMGLLTEDQLRQRIMVSDNDSRDVGRFLNRILGLKVTLQNLMFNFFTFYIDVVITAARKEGKFNEGFVDLAGSVSLLGEPKPVFTTLCKGCRQLRLVVDRGMPWADALSRYETLKGSDSVSGFYRTKNPMNHRYFYLLITPHSFCSYKIARPNTGINIQEVDKVEIMHKYVKIGLDTAEIEWRRVYERALVECNHGSSCNNPKYCTVGLRRYNLSLISGNLMRILPLLETTMHKHGLRLQLSKYDMTIKVIRAHLDNKERLVGLQFPEILMSLAEAEARQIAIEKTTLLDYYAKSVEAITPAIPKFVKCASVPPPTIKSFFTVIKKPMDAQDVEKTIVNSNELKRVNQSSARADDDDDDDDIICILDTTIKKKFKPKPETTCASKLSKKRKKK
ncbi:uncharacterized protein [Watersipora subatra]|uniref:uncharacterized protein n=1 Tax=Watersipora subatra TaxID=2589382 RepID=UPI00355AECD9